MYNRILNRPMFKRGGDVIDSQGTGITSGLDAPRQGYANKNFVKQVSEIDVSGLGSAKAFLMPEL